MHRYFSFRAFVGAVLLLVTGFLAVSSVSSAPAGSYHTALRRYPYLTDVVGPYATINWGTDRSEISGGVRYGKAGSESCTAHYVSGTKTSISVNGSSQYQWKAQLTLEPGEEYCYRVYLGTSPSNEIDLLGSDPAPSFWTQVPSGANQSFSFVVIGDWGQVNADGTNSYQASLMSLIASSGARFAVTTGDNGYPSANQKNFGDLIQTGADTSAVFGPSFWKIPGASMPMFLSMGNHGYYSTDTNHPTLINWPQDRAASTSGGRYIKETYCCLNGSTSKSYPSAWYAFDAGPARFYVLNAAWEENNSGTASEYEMDYDYHWAPGTPQYEWLQDDLAAHPSVLKFAFFHYPLYSDNPHEATDTFLLGSDGLEGLLKQHNVDIAFTGHAHIYERNLASADGVINYITGGGGATPGTLGTCTALDAYAIKFTTSGKGCGSAPTPTNAGQVYHFLKVTVNGTSVTVTPINSLGQSFDVQNYSFTSGAETTTPSTPTNLSATAVSGTQVNLSWSASTDNTGVRGYGVYRNGALVATVGKTTLNYSDINLLPSTSYTYRVDAFDGSANHSPRSTSRSVSTPTTATYTLAPVADAYVASDVTMTNYGSSTTLRADNSPVTRSYLRFNVDSLGGTVTNATLRLYTTSTSSTGYQVKRANHQGWEEGTITYNNAPGVGSLIGSSGSIATGSWTNVDVTSLITGNGTYDLVLTTTTSTALNFNSRDASTNRPQLVIQTSTTAGATSTPGPTPTPAPTSTSTPTGLPTLTPTSSGNLAFTTVADARVVQASPTTNYGTGTTLTVDGGSTAQTSYLRFNVSGISNPIQSVKLRLFCTTNGTPNGPAAYLAASNWVESGSGGITWNNQPALLSGVLDNKGSIGTNSWVEYDVTSIVVGNGTYTFALVADGTDGVTFSSREGTSDPQLLVTLGSGGTPVSPTGTMTPTLTATPTNVLAATVTPTFTQTATATPTLTQPAVDTPTFTPTATSGSTSTVTYITNADARVALSSPTTNYGTVNNLQADGGSSAQTSYIRFDVNSISGPVASVKLRLFCTTNGTPNGPVAYLADNNWTEAGTGGVTWDTQPALLSGVLDNQGSIGTNSWVEYDVTGVVTGNGTYTFALVADSNDGVTFSSREGVSDPELVVTFGSGSTPASPTATLTRTPTATPTLTTSPTSTATPTLTLPPTLTNTPVNTNTPTATPTNTPVDTNTPTLTPTYTDTPTSTPTATGTNTPVDTATSTAIPTSTDTPTFTPTATLTDLPTATDTPTSTSTPTQTSTPVDTDTPTPTSTPTLTNTPVDTDTPTVTATPTLTDLPSATDTPSLTPTETSVVELSENGILYIAEADARVSESFPSTNYGTQSSLLVSAADRSAQISYIRFTVTGLSETVQSVKVRIYCIYCTVNGTVDGPILYLAENDWIEQGTGSLAWNTQPALLSDIPVEQGAVVMDSWIEYDVTDLVMEDGTYTFALVTDGPDGVMFSSREGTAAPQLIVTFSP